MTEEHTSGQQAALRWSLAMCPYNKLQLLLGTTLCQHGLGKQSDAEKNDVIFSTDALIWSAALRPSSATRCDCWNSWTQDHTLFQSGMAPSFFTSFIRSDVPLAQSTSMPRPVIRYTQP
eukprot:4076603-Amphidinium_carterae.2